MKFSTLVLFCAAVFVEGRALLKTSTEAIESAYIVKLKTGVNSSVCTSLGASYHANSVYTAMPRFLGFSARLTADELEEILDSELVEYVQQDAMAHALQSSQPNPPSWGLPRVGQRNLPLDQSVYKYKSSAGEGVDVYILDTGIMISHNDFEGRATWGFTAGGQGFPNSDGNGHGTHCAGTVAGKQYGVAKQAALIAVKVLGDNGSGSFSGIIEGIDWVVQQRQVTGRPSIMSLSLGGNKFDAVDDAIDAAAAAGVHNSISAGNDNGKDACTVSPAGASQAFTVAASDINDEMASFTNLGPCVDVFAPGVSIVSSFIGGNDATATYSGTSMSAPHTAGVKAIFLSESGEMSPSALNAMVHNLATKDAIAMDSRAEPRIVPAKNPSRDECQVDNDCRFGSLGFGCCKPQGANNHCASLFQSCCAGSVCEVSPNLGDGVGEVCINENESGDAKCCPPNSEATPDGGCFNVIVDQTPNLNLHGDP
jgi:cerevisin